MAPLPTPSPSSTWVENSDIDCVCAGAHLRGEVADWWGSKPLSTENISLGCLSVLQVELGSTAVAAAE